MDKYRVFVTLIPALEDLKTLEANVIMCTDEYITPDKGATGVRSYVGLINSRGGHLGKYAKTILPPVKLKIVLRDRINLEERSISFKVNRSLSNEELAAAIRVKIRMEWGIALGNKCFTIDYHK